MTVFPQPKAPGMAQVPPRTEGKRASRTRCKRGAWGKETSVHSEESNI